MRTWKPSRRTALQGMGATALLPLAACEGSRGPVVIPGGDADAFHERALHEVIDTVVIVMMENRSFDHYFGAYSLLEGRAVDGLTAAMQNPRHDGTPALIHPADAGCVGDPPHGWDPCHTQFNDGANDGFMRAYQDRFGADALAHPMGYLDRSALSTYYTLADHFVLCERWHASLLSSTWPNRFYSHTGTSAGVKGNDVTEALAAQPSIYRSLEAAGYEWAAYFGNFPFTALLADAPGADFYEMEHFFAHAEAGELPNVTVVEPWYGMCDDHPPVHHTSGQIFVSGVYDALRRSPQWERCLMIITYDEHGGFFDHVPPPTTEDDRAAEGFDRLGFRVPAMLVGPWVKAAHTSSTLYEHASILAFIESLWGLAPLTARDTVANDLTDALDMERIRSGTPLEGPEVPAIDVDPAVVWGPGCAGAPKSGSGLRSTGQSELEAWFEHQSAWRHLDRRATQDETWRAFVARAERRGLVRLRG